MIIVVFQLDAVDYCSNMLIIQLDIIHTSKDYPFDRPFFIPDEAFSISLLCCCIKQLSI